MGLTIVATGLDYNDSFDCGYVTFGHFRMELAKAFHPRIGEMYEKIYRRKKLSDEECDEWNSICNDDLDEFLFHCDCDGKLTWQECRGIYKAIKDLKMDMMGHNYGGPSKKVGSGPLGVKFEEYNMLEQWKGMFYHCWKRRVNMYFT